MSGNHARRHRRFSDALLVGPLAVEGWRDQLALRHRLSVIAAEYTAHQADGALDVLQLQIETEERLRVIAPEIYHENRAKWAEQDTGLEHTWPTRHPTCSLCKVLTAGLPAGDA